MKLALVLGTAQGKKIVQRLKGIKDNLNIDVFDNIPEFIDSSLKRNSIYDRILVLSSKITDVTLKDLHNYWGSVSKETNVVLLCKEGVDESKAQDFLSLFKTPVVAAMLVSTSTVQIIAEAVLRPTAELNNDYGIKNFLSVEVDEDSYVTPEPVEKKQEDNKPTEGNKVANNNSNKSNKDKPKQEKRSLFTSLFGKKKKKETGVEAPTSNIEKESQENDLDFQDINLDDKSGSLTNEATDDYDEEDFVYNDDDFGNDTYSNMQSAKEELNDIDYEQEEENTIPSENSNIDSDNSSFLANEEFDGALEEVPQGENDFEPETYSVDEDFSDEGFSEDYENEEVHYRMGDTTVEDESFEDLGIGSDEDNYRKSTEAPKVVTQTVVKEVIRNVNTGSKYVALSGVLSGRLKKIVIVTGDRGSGVTSTALNIAKTISKKVDVLYFDCDVENHGLLSYIDYGNFKNYENTHMNGVKLCKSSQAFDKCAISWDSNLYLLTSDYSCDTTLEELKRASEVVAERADDFGVVVVDCPVDKLDYVTDLILTGQSVICVDGTKRGFMNMLCQFERSELPLRYKRTLVSRGTILATKCSRNLDLKKLVSYIKAIYEPDGVNWLAPVTVEFNGKLSDKLLNNILEG